MTDEREDRSGMDGDIQGATSEVTVDEAMSMAVLFQRNGQLDDAEKIYRRILAVAPEHPDALHFAGVLAHQQGRSEEAVAMIVRSLEIVPDRADCYSNLGIIFKAVGYLDDAITAYRRAIELDPGHANAHNNLGVLLKQQRRNADAEEAFRAAIRLDPEHTDAYTNLGNLLTTVGRVNEAVVCYCKVAVLSPRHPEARRLLALAYCTLGEVHKAVEIFEQWTEEEPDNPIARHMLAACSGRAVPDRASDAYVETVFDDFAKSFETKLARLAYRAPALVGATLADSAPEPSRTLDVLDAGCGTGLCGPLLAPYARRLTGVDLSGEMLARAAEKNVYDELVHAELTAYLREHSGSYDVIVSADTLVYFGVLHEAIGSAAHALRPGGMLIFTVEDANETEGKDISLRTHGRYTHTRAYVERVLRDAGLESQIVAAELRMEAGFPVRGLVVRGVRPVDARSREVDDGVRAAGASLVASYAGGTHG